MIEQTVSKGREAGLRYMLWLVLKQQGGKAFVSRKEIMENDDTLPLVMVPSLDGMTLIAADAIVDPSAN